MTNCAETRGSIIRYARSRKGDSVTRSVGDSDPTVVERTSHVSWYRCNRHHWQARCVNFPKRDKLLRTQLRRADTNARMGDPSEDFSAIQSWFIGGVCIDPFQDSQMLISLLR
jgi:hypothetical protein